MTPSKRKRPRQIKEAEDPGEAKRCPLLGNWMVAKDGTCGRYWRCSEERHATCGAKPS